MLSTGDIASPESKDPTRGNPATRERQTIAAGGSSPAAMAISWEDLDMADERGLEGFDPYDLQDVEATRIGDWVGQFDEEDLAAPSGCEGWTRRDLLAHLLATEDYHLACLSGTVRELFERLTSAGATSLDEFNAAGIAQHVDTPTEELFAAWRRQNESSRAGFRAADGTDIDSSVGSYPARAQAFHVAYELAIHADDMDAPVGDDESDHRQRWLAGVSRFALTEVKEDVLVEQSGDGFVVRQGERETIFDRDSFISGVSGRAGASPLDAADAELLSLGY